MARRVVIAAGGTAGHVVPALAVAAALRAEGAAVDWIGADRAEAALVPAAGITLHRLDVRGLSRTSKADAARAALKVPAALLRARALLRSLQPDVVLGGGGYVAGPVGAAAVLRRTPLVLTEADSHLGLTNRVLAPRARRVCLAFPIPGRDGDRYRVLGRPVPPPATDRAAARSALGLRDGVPCVLVFGGSLGARSINRAAVEGLVPDGGFTVLHACGTRDHAELVPRVDGVAGYDLRPYIDAFADALAACDLVVARSGGSIFEVCAAGRPAVLIPFPAAAADHQTANARWMVDGGGAVLVEDAALTPAALRAEVDGLLGDPDRLARMSAASRALARPRAAQDIAAEVLAAAGVGG